MPEEFQDSATPLAEISHGPSAFEAFLDRNQKGLVVLTILIALAAVGVVVYRGVKRSNEENAGAELSKAADLAAYQTIVDHEAGTKAAGSAMVLLADKQWEEGRQDDAIATLKKFVQSGDDHAAVPSAKASLGAKLMAQGKNDEASKIFEELADDPNAKFLGPYALIVLGDMARAGGDTAKAEESYEKVKNFPESNFADTATRRLGILKAKAPVEIDAPPPPPKDLTPPPSLVPPAGVEAPGDDVPAVEMVPGATGSSLPAGFDAPPVEPPASTPEPAEPPH